MITTEENIQREIHRRDFLRFMGFVGAGMMVGMGQVSATPMLNFSTPVKAGFSSLALMDDTVKLALNIPSLVQPIKLAINPDIQLPVAGNIARLVGNNSFSVSQWMPIVNGIKSHGLHDPKKNSTLVKQINPLSDGEGALGGDVQRLAVAVGGLIGNVLEKFNVDAKDLADAAKKDAAIMRGISGKMSAITDAELQALLKGIIPRSLTRFHTFIPADNGIAWTQRISKWRIDMETYIAAFAKGYLEDKPDTSFYNSKDPFIIAANSNSTMDTEALLTNKAICKYGEGLKKGLHVLNTLNQYWTNKVTEEIVIKACA